MAGGFAAGSRVPTADSSSVYPATPRGWVDAFLASAIDDAPRACDTLLSPYLARSYTHTRAGSCLRYFAAASASAIQIERVVQLRNTAVVEVREQTAPRAWTTVVLDRHNGGWQAVELLNARSA